LNSALGLATSLARHNEETIVEIYRLFLRTPGFDADLEDTSLRYTWLEECADAQCLDLILEYQFPRFAFLPVETRFELAIRADTINPNMKCSRFLKYIGLQQSDTRLASLRSSGGASIMHHIAHRIKYFHLHGQPDELKDWFDLGVNVLKNGGDPSYVTQLKHTKLVGLESNILYQELKARERSPGTPFMDAISHMWWKGFSVYALVRTLKIIRLWVEMLQQAGIDLIDYGSKESQIWRRLGLQDYFRIRESWCSDMDLSCKVEKLVYGSRPADWGVIYSLERRVPLLELHPPPGTFPEERHLPTTIIWSPTDEEKDEGHWEVQTIKTIFSEPADLRDIVEPMEPLTELVNSTQDDSGVIMLMLSQSNRPRNSTSRSCSQPPASRRRRVGFERQGLRPHWLQTCHHLCRFDSRWRLCCSEEMSETAPKGTYARDWIKGTSKVACFSTQNSVRWFRDSYLAEIARCQDGSKFPWRWKSKRMWHSGNHDCPQGCGKVDLNQLQVPESLQYYHPRRKYGE